MPAAAAVRSSSRTVSGETAFRSANSGRAPLATTPASTSRALPGGTTESTTSAPAATSSMPATGSRPAPAASTRVRSLRPSVDTRTRWPPAASDRPIALPIAPGLITPTVATDSAYPAMLQASAGELLLG